MKIVVKKVDQQYNDKLERKPLKGWYMVRSLSKDKVVYKSGFDRPLMTHSVDADCQIKNQIMENVNKHYSLKE